MTCKGLPLHTAVSSSWMWRLPSASRFRFLSRSVPSTTGPISQETCSNNKDHCRLQACQSRTLMFNGQALHKVAHGAVKDATLRQPIGVRASSLHTPGSLAINGRSNSLSCTFKKSHGFQPHGTMFLPVGLRSCRFLNRDPRSLPDITDLLLTSPCATSCGSRKQWCKATAEETQMSWPRDGSPNPNGTWGWNSLHIYDSMEERPLNKGWGRMGLWIFWMQVEGGKYNRINQETGIIW